MPIVVVTHRLRRARAGLLALAAAAALAVCASPALAETTVTGTVTVDAVDPAIAASIDRTKLCVSGYGYDWANGWSYVSIDETAVQADGTFTLTLSADGYYVPQVAACRANAGQWDANIEPTTVWGTMLSDGSTLDFTADVAGGITGTVTSGSGASLAGLICVNASPAAAMGGGGSTGGGGSNGGGSTGGGDQGGGDQGGGDSGGGTMGGGQGDGDPGDPGGGTLPRGRTAHSRTGMPAQSVWNQPVVDDAGTYRYALTGLTAGQDYTLSFQKCPSSSSARRVDYTVASGAVAAVEAASAGDAADADAVLSGPTDITVATLSALTGTVKVGATPTSGICVNAMTDWRSGTWGWGSATTNGAGTFRIDGLNPGTYNVSFYACGSPGGSAQGGGTSRTSPTTRHTIRTGTDVPPSGGGTSPGMGGGGANVLPKNLTGVVVSGETAMGDVVMDAAGGLSGTVRTADGSPVGYGQVCVWAQIPWTASAGWAGPGSFGWAMTGVGGTYSISGLKAGSYTVNFTPCSPLIEAPPGRVTGKSVALGATTTGVDYQFTAPAVVTGHVKLASDDTPAAFVCVQAQKTPYDPTSPSFGWGMTDMAGDYRVTGLGAGDYSLSYWPCGGGNTLVGTSQTVTTTAGQTTVAADVAMQAGARITGTVLDAAGAPAAGVSVWVSKSTYSWTGGSYGWAITDNLGQFTVDGLSTGTFNVGFYVWSGTAATGDGVIIPSTTATIGALDTDNPIDHACGGGATAACVQFEAAKSISGTVTATGDIPVAGACVSVQPADMSFSSMGAWGSAVTDGSGAYTVNGLAGGHDYKLYVDPCWQSTGQNLAGRWYDGASTRESATTISLASSQTGVDVVLSESGGIGGIVTGPDGQPEPGVCAVVFTADQLSASSPIPVGQAVTDAQGAYTIRGLAPHATDYRLAFQPCAGANITQLRQEWYNGPSGSGASTSAGATAVAVTAGSVTEANAQLAAWQTGDPCNSLLFPGGDCTAAAPYTSPVIPPDPDPATDGKVVDVSSPNSDTQVNVDQDMLGNDTTIEIAPTDESDPSNASDPPPTIGTDATEAITPYIEITVEQGGVKDPGGNWSVPLEIVIGVPEDAASIADDQLPVFFDESSSTPWKAIPYIGTPDDDASPPTLAEGAQDGYWVKGTGADREIHVLTRHASTYAMFKKKSPGGGGGGGGGGVVKRAQTLASVKTSLKKGRSLTLPKASLQGLALTWTSSTKKVCTVAKSKKGVWTLKAVKSGTCSVKGVNSGNGSYLAASFAKRLKITR